jgi:hypothetical protein
LGNLRYNFLAMGMKQWMTFGIKTEGAEKAAKDIDNVASSSKKAEQSQEGLNESVEQGTGALNNMTGGAIGAFKGIVGGVKTAVMGMRTLKGAMMATGIGALVVIVGSLVMYFTKTKKGAEILQVAMAGLGAIFGVMTDVLSSIGEAMVWAFSSPKEAIDKLLEAGQGVLDWFGDLWKLYTKSVKLVLLGIMQGMYKAAIAAKKLLTLGMGDTSGLESKLRQVKKDTKEAKDELLEAAKVVAEPFVEAFVCGKYSGFGLVV